MLHSAEASLVPPPAIASAAAAGRVFMLHTCQRTAVLAADPALSTELAAALPNTATLTRAEGAEAYELLLRLACGLESRLAGETEVFGQIKQAWSEFAADGSPLAKQLSATMQALFRDVKDIRSRFLSGTGSASYGSLVRRVLAQSGKPGTVLLVGAGQLAHSVAPWIKASELWIWNRSHDKAEQLAVELRRRDPERVVKVLAATTAAELTAWQAARDVVVCVPADEARDAARRAAWAVPRADRGQLVHLGFSDVGHNAADVSAWSDSETLLHLGDMFELLRASNEQRHSQLEQARRACADKSLQALASPLAAAGSRQLRGATPRLA
jgi:glutamyl-tRNA reductase